MAAGSRQQPIALGDGSVVYYRVALVEAGEAGDTGGELIAAGQPFTPPAGNRDLDLVRATLERDEESGLTLGGPGAPAVLVVTAGEVELARAGSADSDSAEPVILSAGEAAEVEGAVVVRATGDDGATFVAAVVGPEVPAIERAAPPPVATPETDSASVSVEALGCLVAYEGDAFAESCAEPLADIEFVVGIPATEFSVSGTTDANGEVTFTDLGENTYFLYGGVPAEFAVQTVVCADADGPIPTEPSGSEIPGAVFDLAAGTDIVCSWYVVPEDLRGDGGSIALSVKLCATAATPLESCEFGDVTAPLRFSGPVALSTGADSEVPVRIHGVSYVWGEEGGLPYGAYFLVVDMPPPAGYALERVDGSAGGTDIGYSVPVYADAPSALVSVVYVRTDAGGPDLGNDGVDMECGDFAELNTAQAYFVTDGGSADRNVDNLDFNRNGTACEPGDDGDNTEPPPPSGPDLGNDGVDMDCADFPELNAAQGYFVGDGDGAARNVDNMDANRNGAACEPGDDGDNTEPSAVVL